jgi:hypothetical protein
MADRARPCAVGLVLLSAACATVLAERCAFADEPPSSNDETWIPTKPSATKREGRPSFVTYGLPIVVLDLAATATCIGAGTMMPVEKSPGMTPRDRVMVGALLGYSVNGPIIHGLHGNGRRAALSLGVRVLGPLIAMTIGSLIGTILMIPSVRVRHHGPGLPTPENNGPAFDEIGAFIGLGVGTIGAMGFDQALARRPYSAPW